MHVFDMPYPANHLQEHKNAPEPFHEPSSFTIFFSLTRDRTGSHHAPAYLLFGSEHTVLKQGLRMFDQSLVLYKTQSDKVFVTGIALHVQEDIIFVSDSKGDVFSLNMEKGGFSPPTSINKLVYTNETEKESYFSLLSFDWLNSKIYMIKTLAAGDQHQLVRCDANGNNFEVLLKNISRPSDLHVDPLNGKDLIDELKIFGMSSRHHIDDFMRGRIIGKIEEGRKITDVAREFDIAHSVVSRLWKSFKTTGMYSRRHGEGRVKSTTPAEDRYIVLSAKRNRRTTAQQVANQFLAASGKQISRKTVARRLRGGGLYARRPVVCVPLTRQHRTSRLQWCREHHN
ncbi:tyrosine-protein kinase receptor [Trichonephila clavipes]|nr:tyrosine-protein kinase receptor [Trichonephila clavipes]